MKKYRIKEEYLLTQWTYIDAESEEKAIKILEDFDFENWTEEIECEHQKTFWDSLEEVKK